MSLLPSPAGTWCVACLKAMHHAGVAHVSTGSYGGGHYEQIRSSNTPCQSSTIVNGTALCAAHGIAAYSDYMIMEDV